MCVCKHGFLYGLECILVVLFSIWCLLPLCFLNFFIVSAHWQLMGFFYSIKILFSCYLVLP